MAVILKINVEKKLFLLQLYLLSVYILCLWTFSPRHTSGSQKIISSLEYQLSPSSMWELGIKPSHHITNYEKYIIVSIISFSSHVYVMPACMLHPGIETVVCMWRTEVNFWYLYWFLTFFKLGLSMNLKLPCLASLVSQPPQKSSWACFLGTAIIYLLFWHVLAHAEILRQMPILSTLLNNPSHLYISFYQQLTSSPT